MSISVATLLQFAIDQQHQRVYTLVTRQLPSLGYEDRRIQISLYIHAARRALSQLLAVLEWMALKNDAIRTVTDSSMFVDTEAEKLRVFLDRFYYTHCELFRKQVASRAYDLPSALDVLVLGSFPRFPRELYLSSQRLGEEGNSSVRELNHAIHSSLIIREAVPTHYSEARIENGLLHLIDAHNFSLSLTLETPDPSNSFWRLIDLQFFLPQEGIVQVPEPDMLQRRRLCDLLSSILIHHEEPLIGTYKACKSFCNGLRLEMFLLQATEFAEGDWEGNLKVEGSSGLLNMSFWRDTPLVMNGETTGEGESDGNISDHIADGMCCLIRIRLCGDEGLQRLSAICYVRGKEHYSDREYLSFPLGTDSARISVSDFLREATVKLCTGRLRFLLECIENDVILKGLLAKSILRIQLIGTRLEVEVYEARFSIVVDSKSGTYCMFFSSLSIPVDVKSRIEDWQRASLEMGRENDKETVLNQAMVALLNLVNALILLQIENIASTNLGLSRADGAWSSLLEEMKAFPGTETETSAGGSTTSDSGATPKTFFSLQESAFWWPGARLTNKESGLMTDWVFLELHISGKENTLDSHLLFVTNSSLLNPGSGCVPKVRSRIPVPFKSYDYEKAFPSQGNGHMSMEYFKGYLNQILIETPRVILIQAGVCTAIQALGSTTRPEAVIGNLLEGTGTSVDLIPSDCPIQLISSSSKKPKKSERLQGLSLRFIETSSCDQGGSDVEWDWIANLPLLQARESLPMPATDTIICRTQKGPLSVCFRYRKSSSLMNLNFRGPWEPGLLVETLLMAIIGAGQLSQLASSLCNGSSVTFTSRDWEGEGSFFEIVMIVQLRQISTSDNSSTKRCEVAIRHVKLHPFPSGTETALPTGPFCLSFYDQDLIETNGVIWGLIEGEFNRSRNLTALMSHIAVVAGHLQLVVRALREILSEQMGVPPSTSMGSSQRSLLGGHGIFSIVPWSLTKFTISRRPRWDGRLLLLTVLKTQADKDPLIEITRLKDGASTARRDSNCWRSEDFTQAAIKAEVIAWLYSMDQSA